MLLELLPICGELLWIDVFNVINCAFCMLSISQSAMTILIENNNTKHLTALWWLGIPFSTAWQKLKAKVTRTHMQVATRKGEGLTHLSVLRGA